MPRKTEWTRKLTRALDELPRLHAPMIDRAAIERLFDVSPRQALRILKRLSPKRAGSSLTIERGELIQKLEALRNDEGVEFERRRQDRIAVEIDRLRRETASRRIAIPVDPSVTERRLAELPPGIALTPGQLTVRFTSAENLLALLVELAHAIGNDFARFEQIIERR